MEKNRVLTWDETVNLPVGNQVWLEEQDPEFISGSNTVAELDGVKRLVDADGATYTISNPGSHLFHVESPKSNGMAWRVWLRKPTTKELAANPWPKRA